MGSNSFGSREMIVEDTMPGRIFGKMTFSHLLPGQDNTKPRYASSIPPTQNIGRTFSPASTLSRVNLFNEIKQVPIEEIADLKSRAHSAPSYLGDSASDLHAKHDIIGICYDWDEKLAESGYGQDVVSEGDANLLEEDVIRSFRIPNVRRISSDNFPPEKSDTAFNELYKVESVRHLPDRSISTVHSVPTSFTYSSKPTTREVSFLSDSSMKTQSKAREMSKSTEASFNLSDSELEDIMRRATQFHVKTSLNMIDHIASVKGFSLAHFKEFGWENVNQDRESTVRLTRETGLMELGALQLLRDVAMIISCAKNELRLIGSDLEQRIGRRLTNNDLPKILYFVSQNPDISYLDMSYNQITSEGLHFITSFLSTNRSLVGINLMCNNITEIQSCDVIDLATNTTIKSLRLNGNFLGRKSGEYLSFIIMFKNLEHLDISQTDQTVQTLPWLIQAIFQSDTLKRLDASRILGHPYYGEHTKHLAMLFGDLLMVSKTLVELHIQKNSLGDHDLEQLLANFWKNHTLQVLDLSCNRIGDYGAELIAQNLNFGAPLKVLMLSHNRIGDAGARALSFKLPYSQIKLLDLGHNRIGDSGIADIIYTIKKPHPILALFVFGNTIGDSTARTILKQLNTGNIMADSLDVAISCLGNNIQCSHNPSANRYRERYYNVPRYGVSQPSKLKAQVQEGCGTKYCLNYMYHNVVNMRPPLQKLIPGRDLEPYFKINGTCQI